MKSNWLNFTVTAADKRGNSIRQFLHALQTDMDPGKEKEFSLTLGSLEPFRSYRGHVIGVKRKLGIEVKSEASNEFKVKTLEAGEGFYGLFTIFPKRVVIHLCQYNSGP